MSLFSIWKIDAFASVKVNNPTGYIIYVNKNV